MTRVRANLLLLSAGAIWGMGFVAQSTAMAAIGPFLFIGLRFTAATLAMLPFAVIESRRAVKPLETSAWKAFVFIGVLLFLGMAAQQVGLLTTTVTNSGFLTGLYVVFTPMLLVVLFRQWPHRIIWPAAFLALAGIWLLSGAKATGIAIGDALTIICAVFWALQLIFIARHAISTGRPVTLAVTQFAVCGACGICIAVIWEPITAPAIIQAMPEILYAGIFSGGIAFTLQAIGQRHTTAAQAAIFLSSEAVFAALFGAIFLQERLSAWGLLGCALIFTAILIVELVPMLLRPTAKAEPQ